MNANVLNFSLDEDYLLDFAEKKLDEKDYLSAIKALRNCISLHGDSAPAHEMLAEAYEDLGIFESAINHWFAVIHCVTVDSDGEYDLSECYESLAYCFLQTGNTQQAAYYYQLLSLKAPEHISTAASELSSLFSKKNDPVLKLVYPLHLVNYAPEINRAAMLVQSGDLDKAEELLVAIPTNSPFRVQANNLRAICALVKKNYPLAESLTNEALLLKPDDVHSLSTQTTVYRCMERGDEALKIARRLAKIPSPKPDEALKIAAVCCENGLHEDAYRHLKSQEALAGNQMNFLYLLGVACFFCKKYDRALDYFTKIHTLYPNARVADYYRRQLATFVQDGKNEPACRYVYTLPTHVHLDYLNQLLVASKLKKAELTELCKNPEFCNVLRWGIEDGEIENLISIAIRGDCNEVLSDVFLDASFGDSKKIEALESAIARNETKQYGVVLSNAYYLLRVKRISIGAKCRKPFLHAYAYCYSHFGLIKSIQLDNLAQTAEWAYRRLAQAEQLEFAVEHPKELAAALISKSQAIQKSNLFTRYLQIFHIDQSILRDLLYTMNQEENIREIN